AAAVARRLNQEFASKIDEALVFAFSPPAIVGLGFAGGFSAWIQDRSGGDVPYLADNLQKFLAAARQRPAIASINTVFRPAVPQVYAEVDRDKVLKQDVNLRSVYQTLQAYLGGLYINQFNRFGRTWRVYLEAEADQRRSADDLSGYWVRNGGGAMVPLSAFATTRRGYGPEDTKRFNLFRGAPGIGAPAEKHKPAPAGTP